MNGSGTKAVVTLSCGLAEQGPLAEEGEACPAEHLPLEHEGFVDGRVAPASPLGSGAAPQARGGRVPAGAVGDGGLLHGGGEVVPGAPAGR
jgi:hypothetical protein